MPRPERSTLSIHIFKTAGTSLGEFFRNLYGPDNVWFYYRDFGFHQLPFEQDDTLHQKANLHIQLRDLVLKVPNGKRFLQFVREHIQAQIPVLPSQLPENFKLIHGHFQLDQAKIDLDKYDLATVIRDPFAHMCSYYGYMHRLHKEGKYTPVWFTPGMKFEDFAFSRHTQNMQSRFLNGIDIEAFTFVGTTDDLNRYCRLFDPQNNVQLPHSNKSIHPNFIPSDHFMQEFQRHLAQDYDLYERARRFVYQPEHA